MYNLPISIYLFYINETLKVNKCIYWAENDEVCMLWWCQWYNYSSDLVALSVEFAELGYLQFNYLQFK